MTELPHDPVTISQLPPLAGSDRTVTPALTCSEFAVGKTAVPAAGAPASVTVTACAGSSSRSAITPAIASVSLPYAQPGGLAAPVAYGSCPAGPPSGRTTSSHPAS